MMFWNILHRETGLLYLHFFTNMWNYISLWIILIIAEFHDIVQVICDISLSWVLVILKYPAQTKRTPPYTVTVSIPLLHQFPRIQAFPALTIPTSPCSHLKHPMIAALWLIVLICVGVTIVSHMIIGVYWSFLCLYFHQIATNGRDNPRQTK